MGTIVTYPREKHADGKKFNFRNVKTDLDRAIMARILLENVRKWVADPTRDAIFNMDLDMGEPGQELTSEQIEEMDKAGEGSFGHTTIIEPYDLELYESCMYAQPCSGMYKVKALNRHDHFMREVDGFGLHYVHAAGQGPNPLPLVITHGWPSTFYDFDKVIEPLADRGAFCRDRGTGFARQ